MSRRDPDRCRHTGKLAHPDYYEAVRAMKRLCRRHGERLGELNVYVCVACGFYHVGHIRREELRNV